MFSSFKISLQESSPRNLVSVISRSNSHFSVICIGFPFITKLISKFLVSLSEHYCFNSHPSPCTCSMILNWCIHFEPLPHQYVFKHPQNQNLILLFIWNKLPHYLSSISSPIAYRRKRLTALFVCPYRLPKNLFGGSAMCDYFIGQCHIQQHITPSGAITHGTNHYGDGGEFHHLFPLNLTSYLQYHTKGGASNSRSQQVTCSGGIQARLHRPLSRRHSNAKETKLVIGWKLISLGRPNP